MEIAKLRRGAASDLRHNINFTIEHLGEKVMILRSVWPNASPPALSLMTSGEIELEQINQPE